MPLPNFIKPHHHIFISEQLANQVNELDIINEVKDRFQFTIEQSQLAVARIRDLRNEAINHDLTIIPTSITPIDIPIEKKRKVSLVNPYLDISNEENIFYIDNREVRLVFKMHNPTVYLLENLLSDEECDYLISQSQGRLSRSSVVDETGESSYISDVRTSESAGFYHFEDEIITKIEKRIMDLFHWNNDDSDAIQVLKYEVGQEYQPHYDYFAHNGAFVKGIGERIATLILYLSEPIKGGGTGFPDLNLTVNCKKGSALYFAYPDPSPDSKTLHSGNPVVEGTKYIATKWFRSLDKEDN